MKQGLSEEYILNIAKNRSFYVDRYTWGHASLRKKLRRMLKENKVVLVNEFKHQFEYRAKLDK